MVLLACPGLTEKAQREGLMIMRLGDRWRCSNGNCKCEVVVECPGKIEGVNPRCACGAPMKKAYTPPRLTYLEFLHLQRTLAAVSKD